MKHNVSELKKTLFLVELTVTSENTGHYYGYGNMIWKQPL